MSAVHPGNPGFGIMGHYIANHTEGYGGGGGDDPPRWNPDIPHGNCGGDVPEIPGEEEGEEEGEVGRGGEGESLQTPKNKKKKKKDYDSYRRTSHYKDHNVPAMNDLKAAMVDSLNRNIPRAKGSWTAADHHYHSEPPQGGSPSPYYWSRSRQLNTSEQELWDASFGRNTTGSRWGARTLISLTPLVMNDTIIPIETYPSASGPVSTQSQPQLQAQAQPQLQPQMFPTQYQPIQPHGNAGHTTQNQIYTNDPNQLFHSTPVPGPVGYPTSIAPPAPGPVSPNFSSQLGPLSHVAQYIAQARANRNQGSPPQQGGRGGGRGGSQGGGHGGGHGGGYSGGYRGQ